MSLETGTYIGDLVATNPAGTDPKSQGDDHLRLIKKTLQNQFGTATDGSITVPVKVSTTNIVATGVEATNIVGTDVSGAKLHTGVSGNTGHNFSLDATADDGSMKLARDSGQDIMLVFADGKVAFPQNVPITINAKSAVGAVGANAFTPLSGWTIDAPSSSYPGTITDAGVWIPALAGWYHISYGSNYATSGSYGATIGSRLLRNGLLLSSVATGVAGTTPIFPIVVGSHVAYFNGVNDSMQVGAFQNSAAVASNVQNMLSAVLVQRV